MRLFTACVTPLGHDMLIDYVSFQSLLRAQEQVGNGVILLGSSGEAFSLPTHVKKEIVAFACSLGLKVPIFVGVPGIELSKASEWVEWCQDFPIDGFLMTSPVYSKPGVKGQILWFESLLNRANRPSILYNIPSRAGTPLYVDTVRALVDHPSCFGVKDSGGDLRATTRYAEVADHLHVYCGDDALWPDMHHHGAKGLISVLSNAWPLAAHIYVHSERLHYREISAWQRCVSWLAKSTNPIAIKAILAHKGRIQHAGVQVPLCLEDLQDPQDIEYIVQEMDCWESTLDRSMVG